MLSVRKFALIFLDWLFKGFPPSEATTYRPKVKRKKLKEKKQTEAKSILGVIL